MSNSIVPSDPSAKESAMIRDTTKIPMTDGTMLAIDIYRRGDEPRPVLLERTPYGRRSVRTSDQDELGADVPSPEENAGFFVDAGYTVVRQDCRGRGDSEGEFVKYFNEGEDGRDTIAWIAAQSWCNGRVLMTGVSYSAHAQLAAAAHNPPALAGMFLDSGGFSSAYDAGMRMGGAFELKQVTWAFKHARLSKAMDDPIANKALAATDIRDWFSAFPWKAGDSPLKHAPEYEKFLLEQWSHDQFDDYWTHSSIYSRGSYDRFPDVPSLHLGSWYDPYVRSTIENFVELQRRKSSPSYLVMGPWTHGQRVATFAGDVDFGVESAFNIGLEKSYREFRRDWFDAHSDRDTGWNLSPVTYFLMGGGTGTRNDKGRLDHGGTWRTDSRWPPAASRRLTLYLDRAGTLADQPGEPNRESYDFDPTAPVVTMGGQVTSGEPLMSGGAFDQTPDERFFGAVPPFLPLSSRQDVLTFRTAPLEEEIGIAGPVTARLRVSSSALDTDFTVKLIDEYPPSMDYPNGFSMNLTDGIARCRFREGFEKAHPLVPDAEFEICITAPDTANLFTRGHRIRVDISSSNFPRFDVNSNTGEGGGPSRSKAVAHNTVFLGGENASRLELFAL